MVTFKCEQRLPLQGRVAREKLAASKLPVLAITIVVVVVSPGFIVSPPYLLMVAQVPMALVQVTPPLVSVMASVPELAVLTVFWIDAVNAENVGDIPRA